ncbi:serine/threonine protein kinase [Actinoplanes sp. SE50]|uniref:serine/threonine protein kinase n=1 Tax=unclassified Actinoplanes TaxID=2626549 RepID=UPI00023EBBE9|nr:MULTISPECIES: serine/threonine-protein kinase [unclassified Actinoplanes]AEV86224.1 WD-40 repeat-containing serine/threonine protein kinase [Actinoplanes sp. SE50/110]ATO84622.1 serine/threonine protein kinase [Actinoplanes sp. SE50]SLM02032.1 serine/threonine protein kinase [Actinoplanes sp. SE50/110]
MVDDTVPGERTQPLRPHDPRTLGDYELLGRLGEGGMGTVYLGRRAGSEILVAVKVVRLDLAHDDEFRRRFRSEVERARQVPPFCTAEVLDADPDHEQPYLVVEFVDGPTLADVVERRGPLTSANLHSVAIGVATALTAIHGAGVIHRDLKPRNVLLAPGTPKVIDFGIARAMSATSGNTRPDQMVGTVAYMAPERFNTDSDTPMLTPAADVFAWGSVVTYAGTGKTPFSADSPTATAARILTQPPRLHGLTGPLRDLVAHSLEKDPANRPSARELLDLLISGDRPAATAAALADQPDLRAAAVEAQAVTGYALPSATVTPLPGPALDIPPGLVGYSENSIVTVPIEQTRDTTGTGAPAARPRRRVLPVLLGLLTVLVIAGGLAFTGVLLRDHFAGRSDAAAGPSPVPESGSTGAAPRYADALATEGLWHPTVQDDEQASCAFAKAALVARRETTGTYRCRGPKDVLTDATVEVGVRLDTRYSCAAVWFRFDDKLGGYQLRVCERDVYLSEHRDDVITAPRTLPLTRPIALYATPVRIGLRIQGNAVEISQDDTVIGTLPLKNATLTHGRVVLGVFNDPAAPKAGPYEVAFSDVKIWG